MGGCACVRGEGQGAKALLERLHPNSLWVAERENRPFVEPYLTDWNNRLQASGPVSYMVDWNRNRGMHSFQL